MLLKHLRLLRLLRLRLRVVRLLLRLVLLHLYLLHLLRRLRLRRLRLHMLEARHQHLDSVADLAPVERLPLQLVHPCVLVVEGVGHLLGAAQLRQGPPLCCGGRGRHGLRRSLAFLGDERALGHLVTG